MSIRSPEGPWPSSLHTKPGAAQALSLLSVGGAGTALELPPQGTALTWAQGRAGVPSGHPMSPEGLVAHPGVGAQSGHGPCTLQRCGGWSLGQAPA